MGHTHKKTKKNMMTCSVAARLKIKSIKPINFGEHPESECRSLSEAMFIQSPTARTSFDCTAFVNFHCRFDIHTFDA